MKVRQPKHVCLVYDDGVCVWNIETRFNNVSGNQYVILTINELHHGAFKLVSLHLAVCNSNFCIGNEFENYIGNTLDITHTVVYKKYLSSPSYFIAHRITNNSFFI